MTTTERLPRTGPLRTTEIDRVFGLNVARHRAAAGLDQYALADLLTSTSGWAWHQNMISKVELGKRPARLAEAYALAAVFNTTVDALSGQVREQTDAQPRPQPFAQLAEVHKMQQMLRARERELRRTMTTGPALTFTLNPTTTTQRKTA